MLPRLGTQLWGAKSEKLGCPTAPIQQPKERRCFLGGDAAPCKVGMVCVQV